MSEKDDWIISSTDNTLGGETLDFGTTPNWDAVDNKAAFRQMFNSATGLSFDSGDGASKISGAQISARKSFFDKYGLGNPDNYNINSVYSVGATQSNLEKMGYVPPSTNRRGEMERLYGTDFSEEQIEGALTNRYGEVQGAEAMGIGWMDLYHTYNKWEQEDEMFRTEMLGLQNELFPAAMAQQRASMAAGGMKAGSDQWKSSLEGIEAQRMDVEAEVAERKSALEDTSVYGSLRNQFEEMRGTKEMRGIQKEETRYRDVSEYMEAQEKYVGARYGYNSETGQQELISAGYWSTTPAHYEITSQPYQHTYTQGTDTGRLLYGTGEDKQTGPSFDEFYQSQFGQASSVENPYSNAGGVSNQALSDDELRARMSAGGAEMDEV